MNNDLSARIVSSGARPHDPTISGEIRRAWSSYRAAEAAAGDVRFNEHTPAQKALITRRFNKLRTAIETAGACDEMGVLAQLANEEDGLA